MQSVGNIAQQRIGVRQPNRRDMPGATIGEDDPGKPFRRVATVPVRNRHYQPPAP